MRPRTLAIPRAILVRSTAFSVPNNAETVIPSFDSVYTADGMTEAGGVLTLPFGTRTLLVACAKFAPHATGRRGVNVWANGGSGGTSRIDRASNGASLDGWVLWRRVYARSGGDTLDLRVFQNSGAALNLIYAELAVVTLWRRP